MQKDARFHELLQWLQGTAGCQDPLLEPASADASFRRYFRLPGQNGEASLIVMDAPPPQEDCRPFVRIAGMLETMSLNVPHVIAADVERGFLLLTDLGNRSYLDALVDDASSAGQLYSAAIDSLVTMQQRGAAVQDLLPAYDDTLLRAELALFHDWLCETHLGIRLSRAEEDAWQRCCDVLVSNALSQPQVFVHRDYHSRNLMVVPGDNPGILDFQDAVCGPYSYDLVSLLKDCYIKWPAADIRTQVSYFAESLQGRAEDRQFLREFDLMGVQRHLKAAGIFARLSHRDGKEGYLRDVPRTLSYIVDIAPEYGELGYLADLIDGQVVPSLETRR